MGLVGTAEGNQRRPGEGPAAQRQLDGVRRAEIAGIGVAQLPLVLCKKDIDEGALGMVAPGWAPRPMSVFALYPSRHSFNYPQVLGQCVGRR